MNELETIKLITRVLANEASEEEQLQLDQWRSQDASNELKYVEMQKIWDNALPNEVDTTRAWEKFSKALSQKSGTIYRLTAWRIAAAVILTGGIGIYLMGLLSGPVYKTVQTAYNQQKEVKLPDGSIVLLNRESSISYEENFKGETRNVMLEGEAFFEVVKNPEKPFIITSGETETKVLGTSFNLNVRKGEAAQLTVVTGKVSFTSSNTKEQIIVTADESAVIDTSGHAKKQLMQDHNALAWKTNVLSFNDATLEEVFKTLEQYFNVRISAENKQIYKCRISNKFVDPTFSQVMDVITKALQLNYEQKGKQVIVKGKGCE